jgi:uncharacterized protein YbaP (TraB family)
MPGIRKAILLALGLLVLPARALTPPAQVPDPPLVRARPALWHVQGPQGDAFLLGSVHVLPPNVRWRTHEIGTAIARSDVFVFEVPQDAAAQAKVQTLVAAKGFLPPGESLRALLPPASQADLDAAVAAADLQEATVDRERPWLAGLQLMFAQIGKLKFDAGKGVDASLLREARRSHKKLRYLETIETQFALLAPDDRGLELEEFESDLKELRDVAGGIQPMVNAWAAGDQARLDELINGDFADYPQARKVLLDDRNRNWLPKIEAMLREKHTYFITVGAGHLTGPTGVPALLREAGYQVEGP